jgi:hypothetical protein
VGLRRHGRAGSAGDTQRRAGRVCPAIEGSDRYTEEQIIDAILRTDYDKPIASRRPTAPPPAPPLPRKGGLFRRFMDGFRYR